MNKKQLNIDGLAFDVIVPKKHKITLSDARAIVHHRSVTDIDGAYKTPSSMKEHIWYKWLDWSIRNTPYPLYMTSWNTFQFTLMTIYNDSEGNKYLIRITKAKQTATLITE